MTSQEAALSQNQFVAYLNSEIGASGRIPALTQPKEFLDTRRATNQNLAEEVLITKKINEAFIASCEREKKAMELRLSVIELHKQEAFKAELPVIERAESEIRGELAKVQEFLDRLTSKELEKESRRIEESLGVEAKYLDQVLSKFPKAQLLDKSVLTEIKNRQGLPAVTLYSLSGESTAIEALEIPAHYMNPRSTVDSSGNHTHFFRFGLPGAIEIDRRKIIEFLSATGVHCATFRCSQKRIEDSDYQNPANYNERGEFGYGDEVYYDSLDGKFTTEDERPARLKVSEVVGARGITIETKLSDLGKIIPREARQIIAAAKDSGLFDEVCLLAEVPQWKVTYSDLIGTPKMEGKITNHLFTDDPLIVGIRKIGDRTILVVVGAFDMTPLELYANTEFTTKIKT